MHAGDVNQSECLDTATLQWLSITFIVGMDRDCRSYRTGPLEFGSVEAVRPPAVTSEFGDWLHETRVCASSKVYPLVFTASRVFTASVVELIEDQPEKQVRVRILAYEKLDVDDDDFICKVFDVRGEEYVFLFEGYEYGFTPYTLTVYKTANIWGLNGGNKLVDLSQTNWLSEKWCVSPGEILSVHPALPCLVTAEFTQLSPFYSRHEVSTFVQELRIAAHKIGPDLCLESHYEEYEPFEIWKKWGPESPSIHALVVIQLKPLPSLSFSQHEQNTRYLLVFGGELWSGNTSGFRGQAIIEIQEGYCESGERLVPVQTKISTSRTQGRVLCILALQTDELLLVDSAEELLGEYGEIREIKGRPVTFSRAGPPDPYERLCDWKENTRLRFRNSIPKEYRESIKQHLLLVALPDQILLCNPLTFQRLAVMSGISIEDECYHYRFRAHRPVEYIKELSLLSVVRKGQNETMFVRLTTLRDGTVGLRLEAQIKMPAELTLAVSPCLKSNTPHWRAGKDSEQNILFDGLDIRKTRVSHPPPNDNDNNEFILLGWGGDRNVSMSIRKR